MEEKISFYLFDVSEYVSQREPLSLVDILETLRSQTFEETTLTINTTPMRTEALELRNGRWLADFTKPRRTRGRGRAGQNRPAQASKLTRMKTFRKPHPCGGSPVSETRCTSLMHGPNLRSTP